MLMLNLCIRCRCETLEEAQQKTDEIVVVMGDHPEKTITATVNARLVTSEELSNEANNHSTS